MVRSYFLNDFKFVLHRPIIHTRRASIVDAVQSPSAVPHNLWVKAVCNRFSSNSLDPPIFRPTVHDHLASIVSAAQSPSPLVEKAVLDLLRVCQRLLPYKEDLGDELLKSLQLVLRLDARVADAYAERITREMLQLVKSSVTYIRWATVFLVH